MYSKRSSTVIQSPLILPSILSKGTLIILSKRRGVDLSPSLMVSLWSCFWIFCEDFGHLLSLSYRFFFERRVSKAYITVAEAVLILRYSGFQDLVLNSLLNEAGNRHLKWLFNKVIILSQWSRMKNMQIWIKWTHLEGAEL